MRSSMGKSPFFFFFVRDTSATRGAETRGGSFFFFFFFFYLFVFFSFVLQAQVQFEALKQGAEEASKSLTSANAMLSSEQKLLKLQTSDLQQQVTLSLSVCLSLSLCRALSLSLGVCV